MHVKCDKRLPEKNKIKSVHAISCLINVLTWDFFVLNLFCVHYQFFTNSCWTWQIWKRLAVFLNDGESLQYGEEYGKPFNWYPLLKLFVHFQMQVGFFFALEGFLKSLITHTENIDQSFLLFFPYHDDWNTWLYPTIVFCKISVRRSKNCLEFSRAWRWGEESENARFRKTTNFI